MSGSRGQIGPGSHGGDVIATAQAAHVPTSPLEEMQRLHQDKLVLCATLEAIADSLPDRCERLTCLAVANTLLPLLNRAHRLEEAIIFPIYDALPDANRGIGSTQRLRIEHIEDECFAAELTELLFTIGHEGTVANADMFGFMLRGFFEGMRRHVAFESEHIAPVIEGSLFRIRPWI